jgi:hypothetical protein
VTQGFPFLSWPPHQTWEHRAKSETPNFRSRSIEQPQTQAHLQENCTKQPETLSKQNMAWWSVAEVKG